MQHLRKPCEGVPASAKLAAPFPISISQIGVARMRSRISHCDCSFLMHPLYSCFVFSHFRFWSQDPVQAHPPSLVMSSEALLGFEDGLSDSPSCWGTWCYPIIWQRLWNFGGDSSSKAPHFPHEAIASPATSHWWEWQTQAISGSPMWGPLHHIPFGRESCVQSAFRKKGARHIHRGSPQTEITLLRRNTLTTVWVHTDSMQP